MDKNINKVSQISSDAIENKTNVFVEVYSPLWKNSNKISLDDLLKTKNKQSVDIEEHIDKKTLVIDPNTLKIKVNDLFLNSSNVQHKFLENENIIPVLHPPKNAMEKTSLKIMSDANYLYVWVGNRWKRILLSEW